MITENDILALVQQYNATHDLSAFEQSFAKIFYDIEDTGNAGAVQLAYSIEGALAAVTAGVCSEAAFCESLKALSPSLSFKFYLPEVTSQTVDYFTKWADAAVGTGTVVAVDISPSVGFGSKAALLDTHQTSKDLPPWQQVIPAV